MLQKTYVVNAYHHGNRARERRRVLNVQQIRPVLPHFHRKVKSQANKRISRDLPGPNVGWDILGGTLRRHVGNELVVLVLGGKCVQKAPNVYLITREVAADGVGINGKTH
jgi:hypothetical protein